MKRILLILAITMAYTSYSKTPLTNGVIAPNEYDANLPTGAYVLLVNNKFFKILIQ